jgi:hypothetical protein
MTEYIFKWGNNQLRDAFKGRPCVVLARGKMNSVLIQFEDGFKMITSRYAVKENK